MKIRYMSDLHLEFLNSKQLDNFIKKIPSGMDEICVLAGDIGNPYSSNYDKFINYMSNHFRKIFIIAGNHEYYNKKTIEETNLFMKEYFQKFNNITFLNNEYEMYDNYCFVGTTLWSKITNPLYKINDVYEIADFDYIKYNKLNELSIQFLENVVSNHTNCVIITHHMPSQKLIDVKYKTPSMAPYNQWFYCDMDEFIDKNKNNIKCWIYGHTHTKSNLLLNEIPFICNPIGYPNENKNINLSVTIELVC